MIRRLNLAPIRSALLAVLAGAAAAYDPGDRARFDLLVVYVVFVMAMVAIEIAQAHRERPRTIALLAVIAIASALVVVLARGWGGFWAVIGFGLTVLAFASGPRLGETPVAGIATVAALGPLASAGTAIALTGHVSPPAFWIGLPIGFLADATRRAHAAARRATAAHAAGEPHDPPAPPWFAGDLVAAFAVVPPLVFLDLLPLTALAVLVLAPWPLREFRFVREGHYGWLDAAIRTRALHVTFAVILSIAVFVARLFVTRAA